MTFENDKGRRTRSNLSSLRARLILLVALAVLPLLGLTLYTSLDQRQLAVTEVQETALRLVRLASTEQARMILGTRQLLIGLAQLREVHQHDSTACSTLFAELLKAYPLYANLGAMGQNGDLYCSALPMSGPINAADRTYFRRAVESEGFAIGDYQIGRITKVATINFGYPILDNQGKIEGVVFAALSLSWLNHLVTEADLPKGSTFSVTDRRGTILTRYPEPEKWVGTANPEPLGVHLAQTLSTGVAEAREPDGTMRLVGFTPLIGSGNAGDVYVSIGIPKRVAYAEPNRVLTRNLIWITLIAFAAFAAAWIGGDFFILRRVDKLVSVVQRLGKGELNARVGPPYTDGEFGRLAETFDEMAASLQTNATVLEHQGTHDLLTGLPNRLFLRDHLRSAVLAERDEKTSVALLLVALDGFKEINDTIGHQNGDLLLQQVGQRLRGIFGEAAVLARFGGDEFAVLRPQADTQQATQCAQTILKAFEEPFVLEKLLVAVEASVGIAFYPEHGKDPDLLLRRAEVAMYLAKEEKTGYAVYTPEKDQYSPKRLTLLAELRRAIEEQQLFLLYEPKIDIRSGTATGVEALVRWRHPQLGIVPPDQFIALAERTGLIKPLTFWVLNEAMRQCKSWHQSGLSVSVAVNLSSRNLETDLVDHISRLAESHNLAPKWLELEITEGTIMRDPEHARGILARLGEMGIKISIDDFGTGYSSLSYLSNLPVDELKIDKSFVMRMTTDENSAVIVRSTIDLAHQLGLKVIAEGVETQDILNRLEGLGCDAAQGYYISRAISGSDMTELLRRFSPPTRNNLRSVGWLGLFGGPALGRISNTLPAHTHDKSIQPQSV
jgi:diguanylate cyclase (GGDEF)-like protein